jgi:hypothetical protein
MKYLKSSATTMAITSASMFSRQRWWTPAALVDRAPVAGALVDGVPGGRLPRSAHTSPDLSSPI